MTKQKPIEQLLAELEGCLTLVEEVELPTLEESLLKIRKTCQAGFEVSQEVHERLGLFKKARK